jgi:hypothetical protein
MGKFPWGRWFAVLKVAVPLSILILAAAIITIIALFDPQKLSAGAGIVWFDYEAKTGEGDAGLKGAFATILSRRQEGHLHQSWSSPDTLTMVQEQINHGPYGFSVPNVDSVEQAGSDREAPVASGGREEEIYCPISDQRAINLTVDVPQSSTR